MHPHFTGSFTLGEIESDFTMPNKKAFQCNASRSLPDRRCFKVNKFEHV